LFTVSRYPVAYNFAFFVPFNYKRSGFSFTIGRVIPIYKYGGGGVILKPGVILKLLHSRALLVSLIVHFFLL